MANSKQIKLTLDSIAVELKKNINRESSNVGILGGNSGAIMFLFNYALYSRKNEYSNLGKNMIDDVIDKINTGNVLPTYCDGIAGAAWTIDFLKQHNFIDFDTDSEFSSIDEYLFECMMTDINSGDYDFLHGAIGYGFYFLERFFNTASALLKSKYSFYVENLIDGLNRRSIHWEDSVFWKCSNPLVTYPHVNLGFAHGLPSIISFLAKAMQIGVISTKIIELLNKSIKFLLSFKDDNFVSSYSSEIKIIEGSKFNKEIMYSRLAWCYGDLGVAISLFDANKILNDKSIRYEYLKLLDKSSKRRDISVTLVNDAGICHGSFGLGLIFDKFYKDTKILMMKDAANYWLFDGIQRGEFTDGLAGFKAYRGEQRYENETNLLDGISGIGLVLLSMLRPEKSSWTKCLFIN